MVAGSRKRRRPDDRLASPPLAPSPLLTRNLQLLPVGLTQLPNDAAFVSQLTTDVEDLLSSFSEAWLLTFAKSRYSEPSSSQTQGVDQVPSPFSIFAQVWRRKGWRYVQFAFADHTDSKHALSDSICRALLQHIRPLIDVQDGERNDPTTFIDLKQLFKIMAVPFALYTFWSTQLVLTSGIGVKHCRPAVERIAIEQDYYDCILDLPLAILHHLRQEESTRQSAEAITADVVDVVCRLAGQDDEPVFDVVPSSRLATRLPRAWPSVRVMSSLEANKEFGRLGTTVRTTSGSTDVTLPTRQSGGSQAGHPRDTVVGLSRGDLIRLKARRRLAIATSDLTKLVPNAQDTAPSHSTSHPLAAVHDRILPETSSSARMRYEIQTPAWIKSARYTAKMKPWLDEVSTPMQAALERGDASRRRYADIRSKVMAGEGEGGVEGERMEMDYGEWVLNEFREERERAKASEDGRSSTAVEETMDPVALDSEENLTVKQLYRLAAERTKAAAVQRGERLSGYKRDRGKQK